MIDFKRLFKHMKEPFEMFFKIVKKIITVENMAIVLVLIVGVGLMIGFLGVPIWITIYLNENYRLSFEQLQAGLIVETIWFFYWLYVLAKYVDPHGV